jgi:hypothetical protein
MLLNTFDFIEKPVRLICYEKHCYLYWKKKWESIPYSTIQSRSHLHKTRNVKALKQTKRQYQVLYCGIRGQGVLNIYLFGFVLIPIPVQCVAVRWGQ